MARKNVFPRRGVSTPISKDLASTAVAEDVNPDIDASASARDGMSDSQTLVDEPVRDSESDEEFIEDPEVAQESEITEKDQAEQALGEPLDVQNEDGPHISVPDLTDVDSPLAAPEGETSAASEESSAIIAEAAPEASESTDDPSVLDPSELGESLSPDDHETEPVRDGIDTSDEPCEPLEEQAVEAEELVSLEPEIDPSDPCALAMAELKDAEAAAAEATRELASAQVNIRRLERSASRLKRDLDEKERELEAIHNSRSSLRDWTAARRHSFAWQFASALGSERRSAHQESRAARSWLDGSSPSHVDVELLERQSKSAKRNAWVGLLVTAVVISVIVLVLQILRNQGRGFLSGSIPTPWPMVGFASLVLLAVGISIWLNFERGEAQRTLLANSAKAKARMNRSVDLGGHGLLYLDFVRRTIVNLLLVILIVLAVIWLKSVLPLIISQRIPAPWLLWIIGLALYLILLGTTWYRYYAGLSRLRYQLNSLIHESSRQKARYLHASTEEARLEAIHALVPDYLEAIARPMHKLWLVDERGLNKSNLRPDGEFLPASVSIADATEGAPEETALLRIRSRGVLVRPGWLTAALGAVVEAIAELEGMPSTAMNLETLASDPGDSRRGVRKTIAERASDIDVLEKVGRETLKQTSVGVQRSAIRTVKPHVRPLRSEELANIDVASTRFYEEYANLPGWSEFLSEALSPSVPFSLLAFSDRGLDSRGHVVHRSSALVPEDLLETASSEALDLVAVTETGSSPLDLVVRIDQSDWLDPECLELFSGLAIGPSAAVDDSSGSITTVLDA